jgi:S1-C subfamily serine protease
MVLAAPETRLLDLERDIYDLAERLRPGVVAIRNGNGDGGAGVIWSPDLVVTNHHVVQDATCRVAFFDGRKAGARVIARDPAHDLALLRLEPGDASAAPTFEVDPAPALVTGQVVLALGHPMGAEWAVTAGILSRIPRPNERRPVLRASVTLLPGNSGGPLVDASGRLIGINTMLSGPAEAIAIPVDIVSRFVAANESPRERP